MAQNNLRYNQALACLATLNLGSLETGTMEITHGSQLDFTPPGLNHRGGGLEFKCLSLGEENTPENYSLNLARQKDFYSPVHHHNFDQFRYAVKGDVSLGPDMLLKEGQLSYHPEGAYYGPQQDDGEQERIVLVLQCGGASGQGYMSFAQLREANKKLSTHGKFEGGKFIVDGAGAKDGYQALWEHLNARQLIYPEPRYPTPIIIDPQNFSWKPVGALANREPSSVRPLQNATVWKKHLGTFSERELRAEELWLESGASLHVGSVEAIHLLVVLDGSGQVATENLNVESTIRLKPGADAEILCSSGHLQLLHLVMPLLT